MRTWVKPALTVAAIVCFFVVEVFTGDMVHHGPAQPYTSDACGRGDYALSGSYYSSEPLSYGFPCTATVQAKGWPLITEKIYTGVSTPDGTTPPLTAYKEPVSRMDETANPKIAGTFNYYILIVAVFVQYMVGMSVWDFIRKRWPSSPLARLPQKTFLSGFYWVFLAAYVSLALLGTL